jgi:hypothetical protein
MRRSASLLALVLAGCSGEIGTTTGEREIDPLSAPEAQSATLSLTGSADPDDSQAWQFDVELDQAAAIQLICDETSPPAERHRVSSAAATTHAITLHGLKASTSYSCYAELTDTPGRRSAPVVVTTEPLPSGLEEPDIVVPSPDVVETGYILYNYARLNNDGSYSDAYLVILDPLGNIRWWYDQLTGSDIDASYLGDGRVLFGGASYPDHYPPTILNLDKQAVFNGTLETVSPLESVGSYTHDVGVSADGKSIFALIGETVDNTWNGFIVKQIDLETNKPVWWWDSYYDGVQKGYLPPGDASNTVPYHANTAWDQWENGRLYIYVSMRNLNQILKIDYLTKKLVWKLGAGGDFQLLEADGSPAGDSRWFTGQHDFKILRNRILMHDNGSTTLYGSTSASRALQLKLDEASHSAWITFEFTEPNWSEPSWGGFDLLPTGNTLLDMGHCWRCGSPKGHNTSILELDPQGHVLWRATHPTEEIVSYRAERIDGCALFNNETFCPDGD